jgi:hypothetical protein
VLASFAAVRTRRVKLLHRLGGLAQPLADDAARTCCVTGVLCATTAPHRRAAPAAGRSPTALLRARAMPSVPVPGDWTSELCRRRPGHVELGDGLLEIESSVSARAIVGARSGRCPAREDR